MSSKDLRQAEAAEGNSKGDSEAVEWTRIGNWWYVRDTQGWVPESAVWATRQMKVMVPEQESTGDKQIGWRKIVSSRLWIWGTKEMWLVWTS